VEKRSVVTVTGVIVVGVLDAVNEHATEAGVVEGTDLVSGGGGVFTGAEVVVKGGADGGEDEFTKTRHLQEVGLHEPGSKVDKGSDSGCVEDGGGTEERGGADVAEELLDVV